MAAGIPRWHGTCSGASSEQEFLHPAVCAFRSPFHSGCRSSGLHIWSRPGFREPLGMAAIRCRGQLWQAGLGEYREGPGWHTRNPQPTQHRPGYVAVSVVRGV